MNEIIEKFPEGHAVLNNILIPNAINKNPTDGNILQSDKMIPNYEKPQKNLTMADIERLFPAVPKYEISDDKYDKRQDSAKVFLKQMKQKNATPENETQNFPDLASPTNEHHDTLLSPTSQEHDSVRVDYKVHDRVIVLPNRQRTGKIRFIGPLNHHPSLNPSVDSQIIWYGVELDAPLGKNNGSIEGIPYFTCKPLHGIFVKNSQLYPFTEIESLLTDEDVSD